MATPSPETTGATPETVPPWSTMVVALVANATRTEPSAMPGSTALAGAPSGCSASTTAATAVGRSPPGTIARAAASTATARSTSVPPAPPNSSGTAIPATPSSDRPDSTRPHT